MACGELLFALLAIGNPQQVTEDEIRLAIDLLSLDIKPGHEFVMEQPPSRGPLVELLNRNPRLYAEELRGNIHVWRVKK